MKGLRLIFQWEALLLAVVVRAVSSSSAAPTVLIMQGILFSSHAWLVTRAVCFSSRFRVHDPHLQRGLQM